MFELVAKKWTKGVAVIETKLILKSILFKFKISWIYLLIADKSSDFEVSFVLNEALSPSSSNINKLIFSQIFDKDFFKNFKWVVFFKKDQI